MCVTKHMTWAQFTVTVCVSCYAGESWLMTNLWDNLFPTELWVSESQYQSAQLTAALCTAGLAGMRPASSVSASYGAWAESLSGAARRASTQGTQVSMWGENYTAGKKRNFY